MTRRERICKREVFRRVGVQGHRAVSLRGVAVGARVIAHKSLVRVERAGRAGLAVLAIIARIAFACIQQDASEVRDQVRQQRKGACLVLA